MEDSFVLDQNNGEIILYEPNGSIRLEVRMQEETVWLTQAQMGQLFECSIDNEGLHLKNLYKEGEIDFEATTEKISVVRKEWGVPHCLPLRGSFMTDKFSMPTYHLGASLKDLGKKLFAFNRMEVPAEELISFDW